MSSFSKFVAVLVAASVPMMVNAQQSIPPDHSRHYASPPPKTAPSSKATADSEMMASMDKQMNLMQEMHQKMVAAKTDTQRQALMAEHVAVMQDSMSMMKKMASMAGGNSPADASSDSGDRQKFMDKRMEMMQSVMQMMVDCLPTTTSK